MSARYYYFWGKPHGRRVRVDRVFKSAAGAEGHKPAGPGWKPYRVARSAASELIRGLAGESGPRPRVNAGQGGRMSFHGAFKTKADAQRKEATVPGSFIRPTTIKGQKRFLVLQALGRSRRRPGRPRKNPPAAGAGELREVYRNLQEIVATKGPGHLDCDAACKRARHTYRHVFTSHPPVLGTGPGVQTVTLPARSIVIPSE